MSGKVMFGSWPIGYSREYTKQELGENKPKQEISDAQNTSDPIRDRGMLRNAMNFFGKTELGNPTTLKNSRPNVKRNIIFQFQKAKYVRLVESVLQFRGIILTTLSLSKSYSYASVAIGKCESEVRAKEW